MPRYRTMEFQCWGDYGHWSAILNADNDIAGIAMVGSGRLALYNHDGTLIENVAAGTTNRVLLAWRTLMVTTNLKSLGPQAFSICLNSMVPSAGHIIKILLDWRLVRVTTLMVMEHTVLSWIKSILYF